MKPALVSLVPIGLFAQYKELSVASTWRTQGGIDGPDPLFSKVWFSRLSQNVFQHVRFLAIARV